MHTQTKIDSSREKMTILQLVTGLGVGGAERVVMEMAGRLSAQGIRTVVVSLKNDRSILAQYPHVNFPVYCMEMSKNPWSVIKATAAFIKIIRCEHISLIHAHMFHALSLALVSKIVTFYPKVVFTSHNSKGFSFLRRLVICMSKFLRAADVIFIPGQHPEMNATKTVVIPNGVSVDPDWVNSNGMMKERKVFLFVGRLEPAKNPIGLIRSFAAMKQKECELWIAGDGFLRPDVEREIAKFHLEDRVRLLGIRRDVTKLLEEADCFVMASLWEGLPMAILEAGAVALPVVAPPVGAIPDLLGDECGYLVDPSELCHALDDILENYAEARRRGIRLRNKVIAGFSLDHMCLAHADLYRSLFNSGMR
ncbi:glycosyltransferase [Desulfuromonas sp. KJ2020]|uniref:glycosyltransferase n=1 Tax=Desulfuromonas sp. KJ2020 TaxID=2919173 RepID=UPI0020A736FD|nr:glycosyltransferase [Desulfuromonas sp. KJ2020]MCP3177491.1 glycosyltransferase [Desulfuromonas sp. KJ2020]